MRVVLNIPKEYESHFLADRFEDCLNRLSADAHLLAGNYEQETAAMLIEAFHKAIPIQDNRRLIAAKRIEFELCESTMPKRYREFCRRVINSERLTPTVIPEDMEGGRNE